MKKVAIYLVITGILTCVGTDDLNAASPIAPDFPPSQAKQDLDAATAAKVAAAEQLKAATEQLAAAEKYEQDQKRALANEETDLIKGKIHELEELIKEQKNALRVEEETLKADKAAAEKAIADANLEIKNNKSKLAQLEGKSTAHAAPKTATTATTHSAGVAIKHSAGE